MLFFLDQNKDEDCMHALLSQLNTLLSLPHQYELLYYQDEDCMHAPLSQLKTAIMSAIIYQLGIFRHCLLMP